MKTTLITVALMAVLAAAMPAVSHDDIAYASLERRLVTSSTVKGSSGGRKFYYDIGTGIKTTTVEKNDIDSRVYTNDRTGSLSQQHDTEEDKTVEVITVENVEDTEAKDGIIETNNFNTRVQETVDENSITGTFTDDTDRTDTDTWSLVNTGDKTTQGLVTTKRLVLNSSLNLEVVDDEDNIRITNSSDQTDSVVTTQADDVNDTEGEKSEVTKVSSSRSILATDADVTNEKLVAGNVRNDKVSGLTSYDEETFNRDGAAVKGTYESVVSQSSYEDNVDDDVFSEQESKGFADGEYKVDDFLTGEGYSSTDFEKTDGTSSSTTEVSNPDSYEETSGLYETKASRTESGSLNTDGELDLTKNFKTEGYEEDYEEVIFDGVTKYEADTDAYRGDYAVGKIGDILTEKTLDVVAYSDEDIYLDGTLNPDFTYDANTKSVSVEAITVRGDGPDDTFNELRTTVDGSAQVFQETNGAGQKKGKNHEVTDTETLITDTNYITGEELIEKVETTVGGFTKYDESLGTAGILAGEEYDETPVEKTYSTTGGDADDVDEELRQMARDAIAKAGTERYAKEDAEKSAQDALDKQIEVARFESEKAIETAINAARMLQPTRRSARAGRWDNRRNVSFRT